MHTVKIRVNEKVHDDVFISFCIPPTPTNAGSDQLNVYGISTTLAAEAVPANATGTWSIISGTGGSFGDISSPTSTFSGLEGETYVLRWTVSNENGSAFSDVLINFCTPPSQAEAGVDQLNILINSALLAATPPERGSGLWSIVSGVGGGFSDATNPSSAFIVNNGDTFILRWTITSNCGSTSDDVTISFCFPSPVDASLDQPHVYSKSSTSATLAAVAPEDGFGIWSVVSGEGGSFEDSSSATSLFYGMAGETYLLRWTVTRSCGAVNSDDMTVHFESLTDIDGNVYRLVKIGDQIWMAENLKVSRYYDGTDIENVTEVTTWDSLTSGAWAYYDNDEFNNTLYGKLYNGHAVKTGKLCPYGWRVPTMDDWNTMIGNIGGGNNYIYKLNSTWGWNHGYNGDNSSGFSVLPAGYILTNFKGKNREADFWSSTEIGATSYYCIYIDGSLGTILPIISGFLYGYFCRCIKN